MIQLLTITYTPWTNPIMDKTNERHGHALYTGKHPLLVFYHEEYKQLPC